MDRNGQMGQLEKNEEGQKEHGVLTGMMSVR